MLKNKVLKIHNMYFSEDLENETASDQTRARRTILYCKRVICLVIYFGHQLILESIFDKIIKLRNIHENVQMLNKQRTMIVLKKVLTTILQAQ